MSNKPTHDLCLKGREYTTKDGKTKNIWHNVGSCWLDDNGNMTCETIESEEGAITLSGRFRMFKKKTKGGAEQG